MKIKITQTELEAFDYIVKNTKEDNKEVFRHALWNTIVEIEDIKERAKFLHAYISSENTEVVHVLRRLVEIFTR